MIIDPPLESSMQVNCLHSRWLGACCCSCHWFIEVMKHPENPIDFGNGPMTERLGYACMNPVLQGDNKRKVAIFFAKEHGLCEGWKKAVAGDGEL